MNASDDRLFYSTNDGIWMIQVDSLATDKVVATEEWETASEISVVGDWLYLQTVMGTMYRVKMDGSDLQELQ